LRVAVLGGTGFTGRAVVESLLASGHEPLVVHRGESEPAGFPDVPHLHVERAALPAAASDLREFAPEAAVDCFAMSRADAESALAALPPGIHVVVLSSIDVYRAFGALQAGVVTDPVPISEDAPLRAERHPYRGSRSAELGDLDADSYEKLEVEEAYLPRGGTVLRLPFVYGEHDARCREELILRRLRAGRHRIPFGPGTFLGSRVYVADVAAAVVLALESPLARGEVMNLAERHTLPVRLWAERLIALAEADAELVDVPEYGLPPDIADWSSGSMQPLLIDSGKARSLLGWRDSDPDESLVRSVSWHLANPPAGADSDWRADDAALELART